MRNHLQPRMTRNLRWWWGVDQVPSNRGMLISNELEDDLRAWRNGKMAQKLDSRWRTQGFEFFRIDRTYWLALCSVRS
jgi:hypothetical protein